ncbi:MAG: hypothetical protein F2653_04390 [Actinobacteria bacterium]|uniref:Unannotated protein n=1 Tax=freshwater metagenome TaxID=449393 RepID=A0A6J7FXL7_9ZZZZ|nr:hypothetical protein [Actinomycetota bacterium]MSW22709.1 hypothetical protein [Actinomycetota bacterium]MSX04182.1 hypothetical protein [Actinomycetota bacterium]MSX84564.1 hypothetical protein [Actinomycetota bacterium]MSY96656.1 hypothetical protein [Actinomycetota bacterium]
MDSEFSIETLKSSWNQILDAVLEVDRVAWLLWFDARLVKLEGNILEVNFADSEKFSGDHNFKSARKPEQTAKLISAILKVTGKELEVIES